MDRMDPCEIPTSGRHWLLDALAGKVYHQQHEVATDGWVDSLDLGLCL